MLSIINLTAKSQFGIDIFPIAGEQYCEPVVKLFRGKDTGCDLQDENVIIESREIYHWIQHHLYSTENRHVTSNFYAFELQQLMNETDLVELICDESPTYYGNAREFVDQLDQIQTQGKERAVAIVSVFCYLWPKSVYEELFSRGYKVILDEMFESRISHLFGFFVWASLIGLPTENFIVLSGRYNAHPHIDTADVKLQNRDMDFDSMGARVVNYPAFFWHFERTVQHARGANKNIVNWGTDCNFEFPYQALLLNRAERYHRLMAVAYLHTRDRLDKCLWSMQGTNPANLLAVIKSIDEDKERPDWYSEQLSETIRAIVPRYIEDDSGDIMGIPKHFFEKTKFSLITETIGGSSEKWDSRTSYYPAFSNHQGYYTNPVFRMNHRRYGFITEKTFRPLAVGHPFVVLGNNKLLYTLHALGFETYDSVWDEGYNTVVDDLDRFHQSMDKAIELMDRGFNERAAKEIAERNKARFWDRAARKETMIKWLIHPLLDAYYGRV